MTVRILARGLALFFMILPGVSLPLGLGEIAVDTHLNQPLRAEIKMVSIRPQDVEYIRIKLAPVEAFDRAGISRPYVLNQLEFTPTIKNGNQAVVSVTSKKPIREPFLNFLVEVVWPKGRLMREYTILLDPPVFADRQRPVATKVPSFGAAADTGTERKVGSARTESARPAPSPAPKTAQANRESAVASEVAGGRLKSARANNQTYKTQRGDTLSKIMRDRLADGGFSLQQKMIATLRANPQAFVGDNINNLKAGKVLRLPDQADMTLVSREEARAEVAQQVANWREWRAKQSTGSSPQAAEATTEAQSRSRGQAAKPGDGSDGSLEILASDKANLRQNSAAASENVNVTELQKQFALAQELAESRQQENEELSSRNEELEEIIAQQDRLINLQSEEIANLQQRGSVQTDVTGSEIPEQAAPFTESPEPVTQSGPTEGQSPETVPEEGSRGDTVKPLAEVQTTDSPSVSVTGNLFDKLVSNPMLPLGLAGLGLLLTVLAWMVMRGSKNTKQEPATAVFEDEDVQNASIPPGELHESEQPRSEFTEELSASQLETEATQSIENKQPVESKPQGGQTSDSDLDSGVLQKDALTDADVYIAYGMHEEAEQRLKEAISQNPENEEYRVKLLEVYHAAGNQKAFDTLAQTLHDTKLTNASLWKRVLSMGREISPDNRLFSDDGPELVAKSDLKSDEEDLKKSIDQFITNLTPEPDLDQDIPSATEEESQLVDVGPESEVTSTQTNQLLDFAADDVDFDTKPSSTQDAGFDAQRLDVSSEELLDFELSDLDVGALKGDSAEELIHSETDNDASDYRTSQDTSPLEAEMGSAEDRPTEILDASLIDQSILDELADRDAEFLRDKSDMAAVDTEVGSKLVGEGASTDAYQPDVGELTDKPADIESILEGLPDDQPTESKRVTEEIETSDHDTAILPPEDEVNTKLDLARAYIDMGDSDGARSTLEEVLEEGDSAQCKEAEELLKQIA